MTTASGRVVLLVTFTLLGSPLLGLAINVGGTAAGMTERDSGFAGFTVALVVAWFGLTRALQLHWPHRSSARRPDRLLVTTVTLVAILPLLLLAVVASWLGR